MATLKTGLANSVFFDMAIGGKIRLAGLVNGIDRDMVTDGINLYDMGIDIPAAVATYSAKINGALDESANYYFKYVYRRSIHGVIGNDSGASAVMTTGGSSEDGLRITIPANSAVQTGVDQAEIYRTLGGGAAYFYDGRKAYSGSSTTYDSTGADSALGATISTDNNTPQSRPFIRFFADKFFKWGSITYSTGTVSVTNGSATVTGSGTTFTRGHVGARFNRTGDGSKFYTISAFVSTTEVTLSAVYDGTTGPGADYTISRNPLVLDWSRIDSSANMLLESFPSSNYDDVQGGQDNEKARGLGKTTNYLLPFTNYSTYYTAPVGANTMTKTKVLYPGVGCVAHRTIANASETGHCWWLDQNGNVRRSGGTSGGLYNMSLHFIANILDGTHDGIHNDIKVDTSKYADFHAVYYGFRGWYMLFITLSGSTYPNACLICDEKLNPVGDPNGPSPWMLWTIPNAISSGMILDANGILRPYIGDDLGFIWQLDTGTNDYGVSTTGKTTTGTPTSVSSTVLTDTGAAYPTTGDGLKGVRLRTYNATTFALENDVVIQSNTATALTVTAWDSTPTTASIYVIGGIVFERYTKVYHEGQPDKVKKTSSMYLTTDKASSSRNLRVSHFENFSATAKITAGRAIDVSTKYHHKILDPGRGKAHQWLLRNFYADEKIEIRDITRKVGMKGER